MFLDTVEDAETIKEALELRLAELNRRYQTFYMAGNFDKACKFTLEQIEEVRRILSRVNNHIATISHDHERGIQEPKACCPEYAEKVGFVVEEDVITAVIFNCRLHGKNAAKMGR